MSETQDLEDPTRQFRIDDQVAVVFGGTGVLCGHMAHGLAAAGADVVVVGRSEEKAEAVLGEIESHGRRGAFVACDVGSRDSIQAVLDATLDQFGRADILVNGAGQNSPTPFLEIEPDELERLMSVNFAAVVWACQVFGGHFLEQKKPAAIVNVGSVSGLNPLSRVFTYSASKGAVHNLSRNLAREWAEAGVRVNTLVPGFFPAEQNRKVLTPERVETIMRHTPANRFGEPDELIGALLLLVSNAGRFINGTELVVDGGFSCMTI